MSIKEMIEELRQNKLTITSVDCDGSWVEGYEGLRRSTIIITNNVEEFKEDIYCSLLISENGEYIVENVKEAYKLFLLQKFSLPHIL